MKQPHHPAIRALLREYPDGMTIAAIRQHIPGISSDEVANKALRRMPDVYIDRWIKLRGARGQYSAIWCVVVPPPNCPYPTDRPDRRPVSTEWRATA